MDDRCPVCLGSKTITLTHKRLMPATFVAADIPKEGPRLSQKVYPCPECSTPANKIAIAQGRSGVRQVMSNLARDRDVAKTAAGHDAIAGLLQFLRDQKIIDIQFHEKEFDIAATATIAVVTDDHANLIAGFTADRVKRAVETVTDQAVADIRIWGRNHVGEHGNIAKDDAVRFIINSAAQLVVRP